MISKYAVYANVTKVTCHDGKKRYLILCPIMSDDEGAGWCPTCPFYEPTNPVYKRNPGIVNRCHLLNTRYMDGVYDTFDQVRKIIEEAYGTCFIG